MSKFKAGDIVKILEDCSGTNAGEIYKLRYVGNKLWACSDNYPDRNDIACHCQTNWKKIQRDWDE